MASQIMPLTGAHAQMEISEGGTIKGSDLNKVKAGGDGIGLRMYDPGYVNTTAVISKICFIDGANGILRYRGYPIEQVLLPASGSPSACGVLMRIQVQLVVVLRTWLTLTT